MTDKELILQISKQLEAILKQMNVMKEEQENLKNNSQIFIDQINNELDFLKKSIIILDDQNVKKTEVLNEQILKRLNVK
jgi:hypothetical protein